ncbi:hypothetical protein GOBAR_DD13963 [Gossypium barbadense]|nr:hypothetical protein GOBAR_DD13963 [Gossypium barbadense]
MLSIDPDAAHASEFPEYADIVPTHILASNSQLEELFIGQQFKNKADYVFGIKQYSVKVSIDYKVAKSPTLYVGNVEESGMGVAGGFRLHLYRGLNSEKYKN